MRGASQLKVGLRVSDLDVSCALYRKLGFRQIPRPDEPRLRFLTFGHTWLILSDRYQHGYHHPERQEAAVAGPLGRGVVLAVPTSDLDATYRLWHAEGLEVTLEPQDAYYARIFYGLDPDGYELMFEEHRRPETPAQERRRAALDRMTEDAGEAGL
jgi:lactoylglutathione lyase